MKVNYIASIIDSIEPYFLIRDLGLSINEVKDPVDHTTETSIHTLATTKKEDDFYIANTLKTKPEQTDLFTCTIKNDTIRILPCGFLNTSFFKADYYAKHDLATKPHQQFVAGTAIDVLAHYYSTVSTSTLESYTKAFTLFFKYYGAQLKNKLLHEPVYIEKLLKHTFVRRKTILDYLVTNIKSAQQGIDVATHSKQWLAKHNISSLTGYGFICNNNQLFNLLTYINDSILLDLDTTHNKDAVLYKVADNSAFGNFINTKLINNKINEWIVIPYFADYHIVSKLKLINPVTNDIHWLELSTSSKISYAGIYALSPMLDFNHDSVRVMDDAITTVLTLHNYKYNGILNRKYSNFIDANVSQGSNFILSNFAAFKKLLFLYRPNITNMSYIKIIFDSLFKRDEFNKQQTDIYICEFRDFKEDKFVYTYDAFIKRTLFNLTKNTSFKNKDAATTPELDYFISVFNINELPFKQDIIDWLREHKFMNVLAKLDNALKDSTDFKSYTITTTNSGYILNYKDDPSSTTLLTNFAINIDYNIVYKGSENVLHVGRVLAGDNMEFPVMFYKNELNSKSCLEVIALRAFNSSQENALGFNSFFENDVYERQHITMPMVFDSKYDKQLMTVLKYNIHKAPLRRGILSVGWDKLNDSYTAATWHASSIHFNYKTQYIYTLTGTNVNDCIIPVIQQTYSSKLPKHVDYQSNKDFLNTDIRNLLSVLVDYFYRTYLGYDVKPFLIQDSVNARNLVQYIFMALGQTKAIEIPQNERLLKSGKFFANMNNYPFYARCIEDSIALKHLGNIPCFIFVKSETLKNYKSDEVYAVTHELTDLGYNKLVAFALETFKRYFKWHMQLNTEGFDINDQSCAGGNKQLMEEGNKIFRSIWWSDVIHETNKGYNAEQSLKALIHNVATEDFYRFIYFCPEYDMYVMRRTELPDDINNLVADVTRAWLKENLAMLDTEQNYYVYLNKDKFENLISAYLTKNQELIDLNNIKIYVLKNTVKSVNKCKRPERTMTKDRYTEVYGKVVIVNKHKKTISISTSNIDNNDTQMLALNTKD